MGTLSRRSARWLLAFTLAGAYVAGSAAVAQPPATAVRGAPTPAIDLRAVIAPPPAPTSAEQQRDLQAVLDMQKTRTPEQVARATADAELSLFRFADVLGPKFVQASIPKTAAFIASATRVATAAVNVAKDAWARPRPSVASPDVKPAITVPANGAYPSGHSAFGEVCAILLANMVPEKSAEIYARGREYGENRVVGGVHYPTDIEAGRIAAAVVVAELMEDPAFKASLADAKAELRAVLGLAP